MSLFPLISELLPSFLNCTGEKGVEFINGEKSMESYKWIYNIIILTLYHLCISAITKVIQRVELESDSESELIIHLIDKESYGVKSTHLSAYICESKELV